MLQKIATDEIACELQCRKFMYRMMFLKHATCESIFLRGKELCLCTETNTPEFVPHQRVVKVHLGEKNSVTMKKFVLIFHVDHYFIVWCDVIYGKEK